MKHFGIAKPDTLVSILNWLGVPLILVYVLCMHIAPWVQGDFDWKYVQNVWERWQSLNVGLLAFTSSIVALNISKFNANKQRERQFVAARAFLPHALSELTSYFKSSAVVLSECWKKSDTGGERPTTQLASAFPDLPESYKDTFSHCIEFAEPEVRDYLTYILMQLQIHHSRLSELRDSFTENSRNIVVRKSIKSYLYRLAELQALINRIFNYARGIENFDGSNLRLDDYRNSYAKLDLRVTDFDDLKEFTEREIAK